MTVAVVLHWAIGSTRATADEVTTHSIAIRVADTAGLDALRGVTGGVPIPEGAAPAGSRFLLYDQDHRQVPCQHDVLGAGTTAVSDGYCSISRHNRLAEAAALSAGMDNGCRGTPAGCARRSPQEKGLSVASGAVELAPVDDALLISQRLDLQFVLTDREGRNAQARSNPRIETAGPMRSTMLLTGSFRTPTGQRAWWDSACALRCSRGCRAVHRTANPDRCRAGCDPVHP